MIIIRYIFVLHKTRCSQGNLEYFNEGKSASARLYHANGKLQAVGLYKMSLKNNYGSTMITRENLKRENYNNGKLEGQTTLYYLMEMY